MNKTATSGRNISIFLFLIIYLFSWDGYAQPDTQWKKGYGGTEGDYAYATIPTSDGGYITVGEANSIDGNVTGHHGAAGNSGGSNSDLWVVKTDVLGNLQWEQSYGGTQQDFGTTVIQTADGGYIIGGGEASNDGDVTGNHGSYDAWLIKLNATGVLQWQKTYGGSNTDYIGSLVQTKDGGYIIGATTNSSDGDVVGHHGTLTTSDAWILKTDSVGNLQWQKCLGGSGNDGKITLSYVGFNGRGVSVCLTADGGYAVGTSAGSSDGDVTGHHPGGTLGTDFWIVKLDSTGSIQWEKTYGGSQDDLAYTLLKTSDKGYILSGQSTSSDGDVTGHHSGANLMEDGWVVKTDSLGNLQWERSYGGTGFDTFYDMSTTSDGGYFVSGMAASINGDVAGNVGIGTTRCLWVLKMDTTGTIQWQECRNNVTCQMAFSGFQASDGGYLVTGSYSRYGDYVFLKLDPVSSYLIKGNVYEDLNHDCINDAGDVELYGQTVEAQPGGYFATTDQNGNYTLFVDSGSYTVSQVTSAYQTRSCPVSGTYGVTVSSINPYSYGNNFGDTLNRHCADLKISVGTPFFRACFRNAFAVHYSNFGAVMATNVTVTVNFDSLIIPISSTIPWTKTGNSYVFTFDTLKPGQGGDFYIIDSVSCASVVGLQCECVKATIHSSVVECDSSNNAAQDCHFIVGSCDPNGKEVTPLEFQNKGYATQGTISPTDTLVYMIRFQNTGTFAATTIIIRDTLSGYLDPSSVESGASSFPYTFRIYGQGILEWTFNAISLPDSTVNEVASHGFVKFTVRQKPHNPLGTVINNNGTIVFDYNTGVYTNTAVATIPLITSVISTAEYSTPKLWAYPNPGNGYVTIQSSDELGLVSVYNSLGEIVYTRVSHDFKIPIDLSQQPAGIYIVQTQGKHIRLIKE